MSTDSYLLICTRCVSVKISRLLTNFTRMLIDCSQRSNGDVSWVLIGNHSGTRASIDTWPQMPLIQCHVILLLLLVTEKYNGIRNHMTLHACAFRYSFYKTLELHNYAWTMLHTPQAVFLLFYLISKLFKYYIFSNIPEISIAISQILFLICSRPFLIFFGAGQFGNILFLIILTKII